MKKITDLTEVKWKIVPYQDSDGSWYHEREEYLAQRIPRTATSWKRIINSFVDGIIISNLDRAVSSLFFKYVYKVDPYKVENFFAFFISIVLVLFFCQFSYYVLTEYIWQKTLGKLLTNTIVINDFAEKPSIKQIALRSLIRFIPFDALSFLGDDSRGWHDKWTRTYVVTEDEMKTLKQLLNEKIE